MLWLQVYLVRMPKTLSTTLGTFMVGAARRVSLGSQLLQILTDLISCELYRGRPLGYK